MKSNILEYRWTKMKLLFYFIFQIESKHQPNQNTKSKYQIKYLEYQDYFHNQLIN